MLSATLFFFAAFLSRVNSQSTANCDVPDVLRRYYEPDVKSMAVKWLYASKSSDTAMVEIPQWCQDTIWSGLAAIFNWHDLPSVDSIFNKYCVHAWIDIPESFIFRSIEIEVDTLYGWTYNWLNNQITTGVATLDTLMARYGFRISNVTIIPHYPPFVDFFTNQYINSLALCDSLKTIGGILSANASRVGGSWTTPNSFEFSDLFGVKYYTIVYAEGGIFRYTWNFQVNPGCLVELSGSGWSGSVYDSIPAPVNCNLMNTGEPIFPVREQKLYPNPSSDVVTIAIEPNPANGILTLLDLNGEEVQRQAIIRPETQIDTRNLPVGVYVVKVVCDDGVHIGKLINQ